LGGGSFGKAFLVTDATTGEKFVIKVPVDDAAEELLVKEIVNNAHLRASLKDARHPNIVNFIDVVKFERRFSMLMEYVPSAQELRFILDKRKPLAPEEAVSLIEHACRGLEAAHSANLVHRDIKPANMLVQKDGTLKLLDFGLGTIRHSSDLAKSTVGTWPYMAPELIEGRGGNAACDVWSLAATAYEMVTGCLPFWADAVAPLMRKIIGEDPVAPMSHNPRLDRGFSDFIMRGLEKDPTKRYADGKEMLDRLLVVRAGVAGEIRDAMKLFRSGDPDSQDRAISTLLSITKERPDNLDACLALSRLYNERWDFRASERVLRAGLRYNGDSHQLHATLAEVLNSLGQKGEAEAERKRARELGAGRSAS